ncbi:methyltransferase family protein [Konateibacter massiliensis]|uniref:methyltransferase family protein n=1 Tax=Konateibacter massiliensis TaxID=2002841 RepID=UPI000C156666|nr:isoprenylcysteine carboxylmethyltransferase family protein [Konateibacter massiliensis]
MNGFLLLIPLILIRYGLLGLLNKEALKRAAFFPPMAGKEKTAFWFYQMSNILLFLYLCFIKINIDSLWFYPGAVVYGVGILLCIVSTSNFANPDENGINSNGLYHVSRNPMYVSYFIYFLGCFFLTQSFILLALIIVFQVSAHWIILSEERWCVKEFGDGYINYMEKVRRYI